jgi:hypothetical protein
VNVINAETDLNGLSQCTRSSKFRGVLRFTMPDTGFLWSHITQDSMHYRENFLGYNLDCNQFITSFFGGTCAGLSHATGRQD